MTAREHRRTPARARVLRAQVLRALAVGVVGVVGAVGLGACAGDPAPTPTSPITSPDTSTTSPTSATGATSTLSPVATGADGAPLPVSSATSPVDSARLSSEADLSAAFECTPGVAPITIPASTTPPPQPPPVTSGTFTVQPRSTLPATVSPMVVVCGSVLAGGEALYLWYTPTPEAKLVALRAALELTAHVHAGPNWVAGGTINPTMGRVGGEVYR